jgi:hypothetical protein
MIEEKAFSNPIYEMVTGSANSGHFGDRSGVIIDEHSTNLSDAQSESPKVTKITGFSQIHLISPLHTQSDSQCPFVFRGLLLAEGLLSRFTRGASRFFLSGCPAAGSADITILLF